MPKLLLTCLAFITSGSLYCQTVVFDPILKDSLGPDSISYSVSGYFELSDSLEVQLDLVQIYPDSLHVVYTLNSGFDQNLNPTNPSLQINPTTNDFSVQCGVFNTPDLMVRLLFFRNEEKTFETYFK
jgi:hypothetical protein